MKAKLVERVSDYAYSSWGEFDGTVEPVFQICDTTTVLKRIPFDELKEWVDEPLEDDVPCLEMEDTPRERPSDDQIMLLIKEHTGVTNSTAFQQLQDGIKRDVLKFLKSKGAS